MTGLFDRSPQNLTFEGGNGNPHPQVASPFDFIGPRPGGLPPRGPISSTAIDGTGAILDVAPGVAGGVISGSPAGSVQGPLSSLGRQLERLGGWQGTVADVAISAVTAVLSEETTLERGGVVS